jgi:hypothetical protein
VHGLRRTKLTRIAGACFALLGAVLFVAPGWSSAHFAWKVSPFLTMTVGAWYLVAAFVYIGRFDFGAHPGGLLYVGLYVAVLVSTLFLLPSLRTPAGVVGETEPAAG